MTFVRVVEYKRVIGENTMNVVYRDMTAEEEALDLYAQAPAPTFEERIEAQVIYTAMMTDTLEVNA